MDHRRSFFVLFIAGIALGGGSSDAHAQSRVFVSARSGSDSNTCNNINTPCQTFQGAVNQVAAAGTVIVLDTGGYGPVTIGKAPPRSTDAGRRGSCVICSAAPHNGRTMRRHA